MRPLYLITIFATLRCCDPCPAAEIPKAWLTIQGERWETAAIEPRREREVRRIVERFISNRSRYQSVAKATGVPDYVIFSLHNMESGGSFRHHLHEGSPLTGRTRWVPKGRPHTGTPPFTWEYSAKDALLYDKLNRVNWSSFNHTAYACERYNGTGYLRYHPETPTQYLWAATTIERPGKYVADGKWSSTARSGQIGIAAIWKTMQGMGILNFDRLRK